MLLRLIRDLVQLAGKISDVLGIDLRELADIGRSLAALRPPPAIADDVLLRDWLRDLLVILEDIAIETPTKIDDSTLDILGALLENESAWGLAHQGMLMVFLRESEPVDRDTSAVSCTIADTLTAFAPQNIDAALETVVDIVTLLTPQPEETTCD